MDEAITKELELVARQLVADGKGILAADESNTSCQKRFDAVGIECTEETRRQYRQILVTSPGNETALSGIIFFDETFWQATDDATPFTSVLTQNSILPGIKVDEGLIDLPGFPGEKLSKGLDSLPERLTRYAEAGAKFAKWRSVITIGEGIPTEECIESNAFVLARYARLCQEASIVPMVEPEVLFEGTHTIDQCEEVLSRTLSGLFKLMRAMRVHLPGAILKTSMVLPGKDSGQPIDNKDVAARTVKVLREKVPAELGGVVFLSGGQTPDDALKNLNLIAQAGPHPWGVTFSFSRALQDPVLKAWASKEGEPAVLFGAQLERAVQARSGRLAEATDGDNFVSQSQDL